MVSKIPNLCKSGLENQKKIAHENDCQFKFFIKKINRLYTKV